MFIKIREKVGVLQGGGAATAGARQDHHVGMEKGERKQQWKGREELRERMKHRGEGTGG